VKSGSNNGIPVHAGIIMDGNGRWARQRNLPRTMGHREGLETAKKIVSAASDLGIRYVTLYTFSTENWKRTQEEIGFLMGLIKNHLRAEFEFYKKKRVRILHSGDMSGLPQDIRNELDMAVRDTEQFDRLTVILAINYGGRNEIIRAVKKIIASENTSGMDTDVTEDTFSSWMDVPELPDMDILIRTGGEKRISNFLLWHAAYAELFFTDTLWPDYSEKDFLQTIADFSARDRRFGGLHE
jgi:undecaprenyl diphosphate synthase